MDASSERRTRLALSLGCAFASVLPNLYAVLAAPAGALYLGVQYNTDDHMVYAAWIRQAMDGAWLFDNRFTTDAQPGLTVHLFFLALGWIAKLVGIPLAAAIARFVLSGLFVWMLWGFARRLAPGNGFVQRFAPLLAVFGAGLGFLAWHSFGTEIILPSPLIDPLTGGHLPTDVWQPEGFVFPSMLTSGLFMAALCLILATFQCVLDARDSWRPVLPGALAFGALMNIHSYDALLIALVMAGFLVMTMARREATGVWIVRALTIGAGALPAALWFVHVLRNDPVFQARAATPTFSPNFRGVLLGYFGLIVLAVAGLWMARRDGEKVDARATFGAAAITALLALGYAAASTHAEGYWMGPLAWGIAMAATLAALAALARSDPAWNLVAAWAAIGTLAPYFPALFQRKLAMGLAVPWALLAALTLAPVLSRTELGKRQFAGVLVALVLGATSVQWVARQFWFIRNNVSNTTVHPVYVSPDVRGAIDRLGQDAPARVVALAMPGIPSRELDERGEPIPDRFASPYMPDLNPILSGLAGAHTYAGHWSETPDYAARRDRLTRFFLARTTDVERAALIAESGATYVLAPVPAAFPDLPLADLSHLGTTVVEGTQFQLVKLGG